MQTANLQKIALAGFIKTVGVLYQNFIFKRFTVIFLSYLRVNGLFLLMTVFSIKIISQNL